MENVAMIISLFALFFSLYSFWYMTWRKGKIHISKPQFYMGVGSYMGKMVFRFPFTFYNDGPTPIIIQNLQLIFQDEMLALRFFATMRNVENDGDRAYATEFAIGGREARELGCEFQRQPGEMVFTAKRYPMLLEAQLGYKKPWVPICYFTLNVQEEDVETLNHRFIGHENLPIYE